ncbi:hypothetical protein B816_504 [Weissella confusa]|uniref:pLS20_p028 family conjugation system transmembrane protein n=1 Tax=Weissella confusa TaxID=1583 RepID=UPI0011034C64|nr:hypothetical protein [Weissella confusa]TGE55910.1 hypothetical protein C6P21_11045 [Weissella confusa]
MINTILVSLPSLPSAGPNADFYQQWSTYLQAAPRVLVVMYATFMHLLAMGAYWLANGIFTAWNAAWKLIEFSSIFTAADGKTDITNGFNLIRLIPIFLTLGLVIMAIMMAISLLMFIISNGERGKDWPRGLILTFFIIGLMPTLLTGGMKIAQAANDTIMTTNGQQNVLLQLWKNNSVDLNSAAHDNFVTNGKNPENTYSPLINQTTHRDYSDDKADKIVTNVSFATSTMSDDTSLKGLNDNQKKVFQNESSLYDDSVEPLAKGSWATGGVFDNVYPRIRVNWAGLIAGLLVFAVTGAIAIYQMLLRVWRLAYYTLTILYFAFRDLSGKKAMQILHLIEGSITGIALLPLGLDLFFAWISYSIPKISNMNLGWWPFTILSVTAMLAGARGLMTGFQLVDEWTGMPSGQGAGMLQAINTAANTLNAMRGLTGGGARRAQMEAQRESARETANKLAEGSHLQKIGDMAGKMSSLKDNAKDIPGAAVKAMGDKLADGVNSKVDDLKKGFQSGKDGVDDFVNKHSGSDGNTPSSETASEASGADNVPSSAASGYSSPSSAHADLTPSSENTSMQSAGSNGSETNARSNQLDSNAPQSVGATRVPMSGGNSGASHGTKAINNPTMSGNTVAPNSQGYAPNSSISDGAVPAQPNDGNFTPSERISGQSGFNDSDNNSAPMPEIPLPDDDYFNGDINPVHITDSDFDIEMPEEPLEFHAFSPDHTDNKL